MAMDLTIDKLIQVLQNAKAELGGDTIVKLYNGDDFSNIPDDDFQWGDIIGIEVRATKSYYGNFHPGEENKQLFLKYE